MQARRYAGVLVSVGGFLLAGSEIYQRAEIELDGTIVSAKTNCMQPQNNRCATEYVVEAIDHSRKTYVAGPTDKSLRRWLSIGTSVVKRKWAMDYFIDGKHVDDFPIFFYSGVLIFGACFIGWSFLAKSRQA